MINQLIKSAFKSQMIHLYLDESGNSDNNSKWNGASHRKRSRPLPLPSATSPSGFVDLADLLQLLADFSSHVDSWPFLKPVTRAEVKKKVMDLKPFFF